MLGHASHRGSSLDSNGHEEEGPKADICTMGFEYGDKSWKGPSKTIWHQASRMTGKYLESNDSNYKSPTELEITTVISSSPPSLRIGEGANSMGLE